MKREINFRAWATRANKMIDLKAITPLALSDGMLDEGDGLFIPFRDDIILMQYTGLKDKNGVEIYEGDILKWVAKNEGKKGQIFNNVVYFLEYRYRIKGTKNGKTFHCDLTSNQIFNHECEVIGNIHQNKELL